MLVLNRLFDADLKASQLDFGIGRRPVRLARLGHKIAMGELWHSYSETSAENRNQIASLLGMENGSADAGWRKIGIHCALLCASIGRLLQSGFADIESGVSFAASADDFSLLMSAWYVRSWGFPIRAVLCCGRENDGLWEFFHNGMLMTDETVPLELERLLFHMDGRIETERLSDCIRFGTSFYASEELQEKLMTQMHVFPIGQKRIPDTISGVFQSNSYLLPAKAAAAYSGAMDYRWATGAQEAILIPVENSPCLDCRMIAESLQIPEETFLSWWKNR